jgi:tetratricopeptide (TPR) repeat protein
MNKKREVLLWFSGGIISLLIIIFSVNLILFGSYRNQLPEYPDFKTLPGPIKEQISVAGKKAVRFPTADNIGRLGMVYHSNAFYEKAVRCYKLAVQKNRRKWIWSYYLGYIELELGESGRAIESFRNVTEKKPEITMALFYSGEAYQNLGLNSEAEKVFKKILETDNRKNKENSVSISNYFPLRIYSRFQLSRIYISMNQPDSAAALLNGILQTHLAFGPAYRLMGNIYAGKGDMAQSRKYAARASDLTIYLPPVDTIIDKLALMSRSEVYLMKQIDIALQRLNPKWAMELLSATRPYFPDNKYLISKAIKLYLWLGKGDLALPYIDRHLNSFSDNFTEMMEVAELLYYNGFKNEAVSYVNRARNLKPEDAGLQSRLALWLGERGMKKDALDLINTQLNKEPLNTTVLTKAFYLFLELDEYEKAVSCLDKLRRLIPSNPEVKKMTGMILEKKGRRNEAISLYEEVFRQDPGDLPNIKYLSSIYINEKKWNKVMNLFKESLEYHPNDPYLLEAYGRLLIFCPDESLRNLQEGREFSERAFIRSTSSSDIQISAGRNLAMACAELGDTRKAYSFINMTVNLARRSNIPKDHMAFLEDLLKRYSFTK